MTRGTIRSVKYDQGYGFIRAEGASEDVFFHRSAVRGVSFEQLWEGKPVIFDRVPDPTNPHRFRADNVRPIRALVP